MDVHKPVLLIFLAILATSRGIHLQDWLDQAQNPNAADESKPDDTHKGDLSNVQNSGSKNSHHQSIYCNSTQQEFVNHGIGEASVTINTKTHDSEMDVCYKGYYDIRKESCCTRTMERLYQNAAVNNFYQVLQSTSSYLKNLLSDNYVQYQELFLSLLEGAHNKTERLFSEVYHLPLLGEWGPTSSLFLDLQAYLRQHDVNIHKSIDTFFDQLFPLVFQNNVNDPATSELNEEYRECLMTIRKDVYPAPFGGIPGKLAHQLSKSFGSARAFLDALRLGIKVVNTTTNVPLERSCKDALTRLEYCSQCEGYTGAVPCKGFCYNVMRGCFVHITNLNIHWNEFLDSLELLTVNMRGSYDIETVVHSFHSKVSEAIMHAMETGVKFSRKVVERCGQPKTRRASSQSDPPSKPNLNSAMLPTSVELNTRLFNKIEMFMRNVIAEKGFLSHLPDVMCNGQRFSAGLDGPCWNGQSIAPYNKSIMTKDISAQRQNPEVIILDDPHPTIVLLVEELQTMKKLLSKKVDLERMQGDSSQPAGVDPAIYYSIHNKDYDDNSRKKDYDRDWDQYGSGDWNNKNVGGDNSWPDKGPMDDEDWSHYGSGGSGSGYGGGLPKFRTSPKKPAGRPGVNGDDITFDSSDPQKTDPPYITTNPKGHDEIGWNSGATRVLTPGVKVIFVLVCVLFTLM